MQKAEYVRMAGRESSYWWHLGRLHIIETYLKQAVRGRAREDVKILNVGCGTGGTIPLLEKYGILTNVDVCDVAIVFMKTYGYEATQVDGVKMPYADESFDLVVAFDVLEHIEEDNAALREWRRVMKQDGSIVITVPAYQWLWTEHDVSLMHFRRYTRPHLRETVAANELRVQRMSHGFVVFLPLIAGFRFLHKLSGRKVTSETSYVDVPIWVNRIFIGMLRTEAILHERMSFPMGTSIIATFRKHVD